MAFKDKLMNLGNKLLDNSLDTLDETITGEVDGILDGNIRDLKKGRNIIYSIQQRITTSFKFTHTKHKYIDKFDQKCKSIIIPNRNNLWTLTQTPKASELLISAVNVIDSFIYNTDHIIKQKGKGIFRQGVTDDDKIQELAEALQDLEDDLKDILMSVDEEISYETAKHEERKRKSNTPERKAKTEGKSDKKGGYKIVI